MSDKKRGLGSDKVSQEEREKIAHMGGTATKEKYGPEFYEKIGHEGGSKAQEKGTAHKLTDKERARGGEHSHGGGRA